MHKLSISLGWKIRNTYLPDRTMNLEVNTLEINQNALTSKISTNIDKRNKQKNVRAPNESLCNYFYVDSTTSSIFQA